MYRKIYISSSQKSKKIVSSKASLSNKHKSFSTLALFGLEETNDLCDLVLSWTLLVVLTIFKVKSYVLPGKDDSASSGKVGFL